MVHRKARTASNVENEEPRKFLSARMPIMPVKVIVRRIEDIQLLLILLRPEHPANWLCFGIVLALIGFVLGLIGFVLGLFSHSLQLAIFL